MKISNIIQSSIRFWLNVTGKKVDFVKYPFLEGPMSASDIIGEEFYPKLAKQENLITDHTKDGGLLQNFQKVLDKNSSSLKTLNPAITEFYEHTSTYKMEVWAKWKAPISWFAKILIRSVSVEMKQLNIPLDSLETSRGMSSEVIHLSTKEKEVKYACWLRKSIKSNKVVYAGFYSSVPTNNAPYEYVRVVFPLPKGNVTVILRVIILEDGSVQLISDGKRFGQSGYYRLHKNKKGIVKARMIPIKEIIHVFQDEEGILRTDHFFKWWNIQFLQLHYKMIQTKARSLVKTKFMKSRYESKLQLSYFKNSVFQLLEDQKKVLVLLRIPNSAQRGDFFFIESEDDLNTLIENSHASYSITIYKSIHILKSGVVTEKLIQTILIETSTYNFDPELLIVTDSYKDYQQKGDFDWEFAENLTELQEVLTENLGKNITLIVEPDCFNEENEFHLYVADENGISKPGHSY